MGRSCLGRPWVFTELSEAFSNVPEALRTPPLTLGQVLALARRHAGELVEWYGQDGETERCGLGLRGGGCAAVPCRLPRRKGRKGRARGAGGDGGARSGVFRNAVSKNEGVVLTNMYGYDPAHVIIYAVLFVQSPASSCQVPSFTAVLCCGAGRAPARLTPRRLLVATPGRWRRGDMPTAHHPTTHTCTVRAARHSAACASSSRCTCMAIQLRPPLARPSLPPL